MTSQESENESSIGSMRQDLSKKIHALLRNNYLHDDTRNVVALGLLTRMSTCDKRTIMSESMDSTKWFSLNIRLLRSSHAALIGLASHWVSLSQNRQHNWVLMADTLFYAIKDRTNLPIASADHDLLYALVCCGELTGEIKTWTTDIDAIWNRFFTASPLDTVDRGDVGEREALCNHWLFVDEILMKLLQQWNENTWMTSFLRLWELLDLEGSSVPAWYELMLLTDVSMDSNLIPIHEWHKHVFDSTISIVVKRPDINFTNTKIAKSLADIITAHIGSPHSDLHSQGWETCATLVTKYNWDWIPKPENEPFLLQSLHMCTWTRLAAGEYGIQLNLLSSEVGALYQQQTLSACGSVVVSAFREVVQEAAALDNGKQPLLCANSILHLRKSFQDTLQVTIDYVASSPEPIRACCAVLGSLLGESSMWDEVPTFSTIEHALLAIQKCILCNVVEIMPCLANALDLVQRQGEGVRSIANGPGFHGAGLLEYFSYFWTEYAFTHPGLIQWASFAIERWLTIVDVSMAQRRRLSKHVLEWIEKILQSRDEDCFNDYDSVLATAGCYLTLIGNDAQSEHESALIRKAMSRYQVADDLD